MSLIVVSSRVSSDANCANRPCMLAVRAATPRDEAVTRPALVQGGLQGGARDVGSGVGGM
jgi:hypothetical protein